MCFSFSFPFFLLFLNFLISPSNCFYFRCLCLWLFILWVIISWNTAAVGQYHSLLWLTVGAFWIRHFCTVFLIFPNFPSLCPTGNLVHQPKLRDMIWHSILFFSPISFSGSSCYSLSPWVLYPMWWEKLLCRYPLHIGSKGGTSDPH